jgi:hypothetical protein
MNRDSAYPGLVGEYRDACRNCTHIGTDLALAYGQNAETCLVVCALARKSGMMFWQIAKATRIEPKRIRAIMKSICGSKLVHMRTRRFRYFLTPKGYRIFREILAVERG